MGTANESAGGGPKLRSAIAPRTSRSGSRTVVAAMLANLVIALAKFVTAGITGSSAMLSEGIHSLLDTGNQGLLLLGDRRSRKPPDERHPFGYGRELYFWSLIVAIVLFGMGGGLSLYEGIAHLAPATAPSDPSWNYVVLVVAFAAEGMSLRIAMREFLRRKEDVSLWRAFRASKDPRIFVPLAEDVAALAGIVVAFFGVFLSQRLGSSVFDAISSLVIGLILGAVALLLAAETRGLLVGEAADERVLRRIRHVACQDPAVLEIRHAVTLQLGPEEVLLNLGVHFRPGQSVRQVATAIRRLEQHIRAAERRITCIFVEVEPRSTAAAQVRPSRVAHRPGSVG